MSQIPDTSEPRRLRPIYLLLIFIWLGITTARLMQAVPLASANDRSRWCTVWSLVEKGTYQIDEIRQKPGWDTIDKIKLGDHFYSSKPPILATLVAGLYSGVRKLPVPKDTPPWTLDARLEEVVRFILLLINVLPMALGLGLFARLIHRQSTSDFTRVFLVAAACFATLLQPFHNTLNNHSVAGISLLFALHCIGRIFWEDKRGLFTLFSAGFWLSLLMTFELPAGLLGLLVLFGLWRRGITAGLLPFIIGGLIPVAFFFATNVAATGDWRPAYTYYGSAPYEYIHEGIPSYWIKPGGIDSNRDSFPIYLLHCLVGHHGIFSLSPIFLLMIPGWFLALGRSGRSREYLGWSAVVTIVVLAYYLTRTGNYNFGGNSVALRWLVWVTPLWLLAMIPALDSISPRGWLRAIACLLLGVSTFSAWYPWNGPWGKPWLMLLMERWQWIDYSDPMPNLPRKIENWIFTLPDSPQTDPDYWVEFQATAAAGGLQKLRLADAGPTELDGKSGRILDVTLTTKNNLPKVLRLVINPEPFLQGKPAADCLLWDDTTPPDGRREAELFLTGLPSRREYKSGRVAYEKTPLRLDAFRTQRAVAQVAHKSSEPTGELKFRREVWLTADIPFGVLRSELQISDSATNTLQAKEVWLISAAGKFPPASTETVDSLKSR